MVEAKGDTLLGVRGSINKSQEWMVSRIHLVRRIEFKGLSISLMESDWPLMKKGKQRQKRNNACHLSCNHHKREREFFALGEPSTRQG